MSSDLDQSNPRPENSGAFSFKRTAIFAAVGGGAGLVVSLLYGALGST